MKPITTVVGRLGGDADLKFLPSGKAVANFNLACDDREKLPSGEWQQKGETLWIKVTCWDKLAENVSESLHKGDEVVVVGPIDLRKWTSKDGKEGQSLELTARTVGASLAFRSLRHSKDQAALDTMLSGANAANDQLPPF